MICQKPNPDKLNDMITRYEEILGKDKKEAEKLDAIIRVLEKINKNLDEGKN